MYTTFIILWQDNNNKSCNLSLLCSLFCYDVVVFDFRFALQVYRFFYLRIQACFQIKQKLHLLSDSLATTTTTTIIEKGKGIVLENSKAPHSPHFFRHLPERCFGHPNWDFSSPFWYCNFFLFFYIFSSIFCCESANRPYTLNIITNN